MYEKKVKFWCNAGETEETVTVKIYENCGTEEQQINEAFIKWVDNNEDIGWDYIDNEQNVDDDDEE